MPGDRVKITLGRLDHDDSGAIYIHSMQVLTIRLIYAIGRLF